MYYKENYFIFNDFDSRDYGIHIEEMPEIIRPEEKIDIVKVDGRDGFLSYSTGAYESFQLSITCKLKDETLINTICGTFRGTGKLILSTLPECYYNVLIKNQISFERVFRKFRSFTIVFECQPYRYEIENYPLTYTKTSSPIKVNLFNPTNATFLPTIKVYGNGSTTMTINGNEFKLTIDDYMELSFETEDATKDGANRNNKIYGEFVPLIQGMNEITCGTSITKLEITPNFRWC